MRYLERLKQRATNISVLSPNTASSHLLAHVVLEEDLLDLGGDQVGVQTAGQSRHLIQTRGRCVKKLGYNCELFILDLSTDLLMLGESPEAGAPSSSCARPGGR